MASNPPAPNRHPATGEARNLTFGVEYELIFSTRHPDLADGTPGESYFPTSSLSQVEYDGLLKEQSNPFFPDEGPKFLKYGIPSEAVVNELVSGKRPAWAWFRRTPSQFPSKDTGSKKAWYVTTDISIEDEDDCKELVEPLGLEVVSRVLRRPFTNNEVKDLRGVREATSTLTYLKQRFQIDVNETCGLHVHVGRDEAGFPLPWLKNLVSFLYTFEPGIEKVHSWYRRTDTHCRPMRSGVAKELRQADCPIQLIMAQTDEETVIELMAEEINAMGGTSAYNLRNLHPANREAVRSGKRTIEFRGHTGTTDPEEVKRWVMFCLQVVDFAGRTTNDAMERICQRELRNQEKNFGACYMPLPQICDLIAFPDGAEAWSHIGNSEINTWDYKERGYMSR